MYHEIITFLKKHVIHCVLLPLLGLTLFTAVHEAAHGIAVLCQGGTIEYFRWWPTLEGFGYIQYSFPGDIEFSNFLISFAPYILWFILVAISSTASYFINTRKFWVYSTIFIWCYFLPLGDIALVALKYVIFQKNNDFYNAFGTPTLTITIAIIAMTLLAIPFSYLVHKNLYRSASLSIKSFVLLAFVAITCITFI